MWNSIQEEWPIVGQKKNFALLNCNAGLIE